MDIVDAIYTLLLSIPPETIPYIIFWTIFFVVLEHENSKELCLGAKKVRELRRERRLMEKPKKVERLKETKGFKEFYAKLSN